MSNDVYKDINNKTISVVAFRVVLNEDLEISCGGGCVGEAFLGLLVMANLIVVFDNVLGEFRGPQLSPGLLQV